MKQNLILVTGATGMQGGAVIDALLSMHMPVRALIRHKNKDAAQVLATRGIELVEGDLEDIDSLKRAVTGAWGVFSVQLPSPVTDPESEYRHGSNLIKAAKAAGITSFVQSSVARAGEHTEFADWDKGRWYVPYWTGKKAVNDALRKADFPYWTILKPALVMDNLLPPKGDSMYPALKQGEIITSTLPETKVDWISARDMGRFAAQAFAEPERFNKREIALAAEKLTYPEVAGLLEQVTGKKVTAKYLTVDEAGKVGIYKLLASSFEWMNVEGYKVDIAECASYGISLEDMRSFLMRNREKIIINHP